MRGVILSGLMSRECIPVPWITSPIVYRVVSFFSVNTIFADVFAMIGFE